MWKIMIAKTILNIYNWNFFGFGNQDFAAMDQHVVYCSIWRSLTFSWFNTKTIIVWKNPNLFFSPSYDLHD